MTMKRNMTTARHSIGRCKGRDQGLSVFALLGFVAKARWPGMMSHRQQIVRSADQPRALGRRNSRKLCAPSIWPKSDCTHRPDER